MASTEQGGTDQTDRGLRKDYFNSSGIGKFVSPVCKLLQVIVAIICIGLIDDPANNSRFRVFVSARSAALAYSTFVTFLIFPVIYLFGKLLRENVPWKLQSLLNLIAFIMYIATAVCVLSDWSDAKTKSYWPPNTQRMDFQCAVGSLAIIGSLLFLIDLITTVRLGIKGDIE
ncbi:uncharacterized protein LOC131427461 isoform X2 [Malaya genurostris]|nr:uncharacterized protein LOC131427461 isoform X2 [Malaya genurostris]XP_058446650.1 uncharacterized protein LOC131427461 isoform X2 [Malaya genurostris]